MKQKQVFILSLVLNFLLLIALFGYLKQNEGNEKLLGSIMNYNTSVNTSIDNLKNQNQLLKNELELNNSFMKDLAKINIELLTKEISKIQVKETNIIELKQLYHKGRIIGERSQSLETDTYKSFYRTYRKKTILYSMYQKQVTEEQDDNYNNLVISNIEIDDGKIKKDNNVSSVNNKDFLTYIQKPYENTCVIDSMGLILEKEYGLKINKSKIYELSSKKLGEYWQSGYYSVGIYGGKFEERGDVGDFRKLSAMGIDYGFSSNLKYIKQTVKNGRPVLLQAPMRFFDSDSKWELDRNKNIWHAVSVYEIDDTYMYYSNTLNGKLEKLEIKSIMNDNTYLKYPVTIFRIDEEKLNKDILLKK